MSKSKITNNFEEILLTHKSRATIIKILSHHLRIIRDLSSLCLLNNSINNKTHTSIVSQVYESSKAISAILNTSKEHFLKDIIPNKIVKKDSQLKNSNKDK